MLFVLHTLHRGSSCVSILVFVFVIIIIIIVLDSFSFQTSYNSEFSLLNVSYFFGFQRVGLGGAR